MLYLNSRLNTGILPDSTNAPAYTRLILDRDQDFERFDRGNGNRWQQGEQLDAGMVR